MTSLKQVIHFLKYSRRDTYRTGNEVNNKEKNAAILAYEAKIEELKARLFFCSLSRLVLSICRISC